MTSIRNVAFSALLFIVGAAPLAADYWPRPAKTPDTDVTCAACADTKGKKAPGYPATLGAYVGRYLDSESVIEWQQPFRAARARSIVPMPSLNRLYFIIGSSVMSYDMNRFFQRVNSGEALINVQNVPGCDWSSYPRTGNAENFLRWDGFFYAESAGSGWITPITDGYQRLYGLDVDDQGYVYMAYSFFGWGIAKDLLTADGSAMQSVVQLIEGSSDPTLIPSDVQPKMIAVLKGSNGSYYAVISDNSSSKLSVYDVTSRAHPQKRVSVSKSMLNFAKSGDSTRIGIATVDGRFEIYTTDSLIAGGSPLLSVAGPGGAPVRGVASDGTNFYIASDDTSSLIITTYAPSGGSYSKVGDFRGNRGSLATQNLRWGDGYLVQSGVTDGSSELRLFKASVTDVSEVNLAIPAASGFKPYYFKNFYVANNSGRSDYTAPPLWGYFWDSAVVKSAGKSYLIVTGMILGDVYEVKGSDSITVTNNGVTGSANPNRPAGASPGPFYGDPIGFTASTTGAAQTNITWDFGNPEAATIAADPNSGPGLTGVQISHRYSGLTAPSSLPTTRTVTATNVTNSSINGSIAVTLAAPGVSIALKNVQGSTLPASGVSSVPIVVGDNFVDTSDGSVQSHFDSWTIDSATTKTLPNESVSVGACAGTHTLAMTAHYGPYTGTSPNETSLSDMPIGVSGITYSVRPFVAAISTASTSTDITFSSTSRFTGDTSVLSAAQLAALTWKWDLLDANNGIVQSGPSGAGFVAPWTVAKSLFTSRGIRARLTLTSPTPVTGGCANLSMETSTAFTQALNGPDPALNGDCTNGGPPCSFNISSASGVNQTSDGWTYSWSTSPTNGVVFNNSASSTFTPTFTIVGNYTVSCTVTNAISSKTVAKTVNVTTVGSVCPTIVPGNNVFMYYQGDACSYVSPTSPCSAGKSITFSAAGPTYPWNCSSHTFTWNWGDNSPAGSGQTTSHTFNGVGSYTVTLTVADSSQSVPITATIPVGNVVTPPPVTPPPVTPPVTPPPTPGGCGTMIANTNVFISYQTASFSCSYVSTAACPIGEPVQFNAAAFGYDFTCGTHSFVWNFGDGSNPVTTQQAVHTFNTANTYNVSLTITGPTGQQVSMSVPVKVGAGSGTPTPPVTPPPVTPPVTPPPTGGCGTINNNNVFITYTGASSGCSYVGGNCNQNEDVNFNVASFGYDFNCATHSFSWDFNDGTDPGSGRQITHRFAGPGTYNVRVGIAVNGTTTPVSAVVVVGNGNSGGGPTPPPVTPPTNFPFDFTIVPRQINGTMIPHEYVFTAFAHDSSTTTKYKWDFGDSTTSETTAPTVNHAYADGKDYTITLTVTGYSGSVTHTLSPPRRRSAGH